MKVCNMDYIFSAIIILVGVLGCVRSGKPEAPTNVTYSDVTEHSVTLYWVPGNDTGSHQYFLVMMLIEVTKLYLQISPQIFCPYTNLQPNQTCNYTLENLGSNTHYNLKIGAKTYDYRYVILSNQSVEFTTKDRSKGPDSSHQREVITGIIIGTICVVIVVAGAIYFQMRRKNSSYTNIATDEPVESRHIFVSQYGTEETNSPESSVVTS